MLADSKWYWRGVTSDAAAGAFHACHDGGGLISTQLEFDLGGGRGAAAALAAAAVAAAEAPGAACASRLLRGRLPAAGAAGAAGAGRARGTGGGAGGGDAREARRACVMSGACAHAWLTPLAAGDLGPGGRVTRSSRPWFVLVSRRAAPSSSPWLLQSCPGTALA